MLGVGEKLSPLSSSSMSCGVSLYVLRLWIVKSDVCLWDAGIKKKLKGLVGGVLIVWWLRGVLVGVSLQVAC